MVIQQHAEHSFRTLWPGMTLPVSSFFLPCLDLEVLSSLEGKDLHQQHRGVKRDHELSTNDGCWVRKSLFCGYLWEWLDQKVKVGYMQNTIVLLLVS